MLCLVVCSIHEERQLQLFTLITELIKFHFHLIIPVERLLDYFGVNQSM